MTDIISIKKQLF